MEKHLGRNPFEKAKNRGRKLKLNPHPRKETSAAEWLLVELPANAIILGLKTSILIKSLIDQSSKKTGS